MSIKCLITKKTTSFGKKYSIRGIAKKKKGIGLKTTSIKRRKFKINAFKKKVWSVQDQRFYTVKVSAKGLKQLTKIDVATLV